MDCWKVDKNIEDNLIKSGKPSTIYHVELGKRLKNRKVSIEKETLNFLQELAIYRMLSVEIDLYCHTIYLFKSIKNIEKFKFSIVCSDSVDYIYKDKILTKVPDYIWNTNTEYRSQPLNNKKDFTLVDIWISAFDIIFKGGIYVDSQYITIKK